MNQSTVRAPQHSRAFAADCRGGTAATFLGSVGTGAELSPARGQGAPRTRPMGWIHNLSASFIA